MSEPWIHGVVVLVTCGYCKGKRRFPGGEYKAQGEVVNCPCCNGSGREQVQITIGQLKKALADSEHDE